MTTLENINASFTMISVERTLKKHILSIHGGYKPFICEICGGLFTLKSNLKMHIATVHENPRKKPYKCRICGGKFLNNNELKRHMQTVHDIPVTFMARNFHKKET